MKWYEIRHTCTNTYILVYTSLYLFHHGLYKYMNIQNQYKQAQTSINKFKQVYTCLCWYIQVHTLLYRYIHDGCKSEIFCLCTTPTGFRGEHRDRAMRDLDVPPVESEQDHEEGDHDPCPEDLSNQMQPKWRRQ